VQEPEPFGLDLRVHRGDTGDVATRPAEAGDEAGLDRVYANAEDDWNRRGRCLRRKCRGSTHRDNDSHLTAYEIAYQHGQLIVVALGPAILDDHVAALDIAGFAQSFTDCRHHVSARPWRTTVEKPDHRHRLLLRARRERPRGRGTEQRDEIAAPQLGFLRLGPHFTTPLRREGCCASQQN
jgi:hypothetical protein